MSSTWNDWARDPTVLVVSAGVLVILAVGTLVRLLTARLQRRPVARPQRASLLTWWMLAAALLGATLLGPVGVAGLLVAASSLAIGEYLRLAFGAPAPRLVTASCYGLIFVHHGLILSGQLQAALVFLPLAGFLVLSWVSMWQQDSEHFLSTAARSHWGLMLAAYCPSHAAMLFGLDLGGRVSPASLFLYLIIMTEVNDIAQALVGRRWGRHSIAPVLSPKKTWEGFAGGMAITTAVATPAALWMTPLASRRAGMFAGDHLPEWFAAVLLGLTIAVGGLVGDLTVSAVKRAAQVKDSSDLLPGQGGMLDRLDSLTLTAPAVYYLVIFLPDSWSTP